MGERVARLEAKLDELTAALRRLEARLAALEAAVGVADGPITAASAAEAPTAPAAALEPARLPGALSLVGRSFLVLGGAFLVRALTEAGSLPRPAGVALGLLYAVTWIALAGREGRKREAASAAFHGVTAVVIAFPLVFEATTRFGVLSGRSAAGAVAAVGGACLAVAWRERLHALAWAATLASLATVVALLRATHAIEALTCVLLLLGIATLWLSYDRDWYFLRWPPALAADLAVMLMASLVAREGGPPEAYRDLSLPGAVALTMALPLLYLSSFAVRTLARDRDVVPFEAFQTLATLFAGFGGALDVARSAGFGATGLGATALTLGAGCYAVAFAFVERRPGSARNFLFYSSLALVLLLSGSAPALGAAFLAVFWCTLGLAAAVAGGLFDRSTLRAHSAVYVAAAALQSQLLVSSLDAFSAPAELSRPALTPAALLVLVVAAACYFVLVAMPSAREQRWPARLPEVAHALFGVVGAGAVAVLCLAWLVGVGHDPAALAAVRTLVLSVAALALAASGRSAWLPGLAWLAYPVLVAGGLKLLAEDLPRGRPGTLFLAFVAYGLALIGTPRLLRPRA